MLRLVGRDRLGPLGALQRQDFRRQVVRLRLREQSRYQRAQDEEHQRQRRQGEGEDFADAHKVELVQFERPRRRRAIHRRVGPGKGGAFDRHDVAALFVEQDG